MTSCIFFKFKGSRSPAHQQVSFEGPSVTVQQLQALIVEKVGLDATRSCIVLLQPGTGEPYPPDHEFAPNALVIVKHVPLPAAALAAPHAKQAVAGAHHPADPGLRGVPRPPVGGPRGALPEAQAPAVALAAAAAQGRAPVVIPPLLPAAAAPAARAAGQALAAVAVQEVEKPVTPTQEA